MKLRLAAAVLVCVVLATGAWAQFGGFSPRAMAMGGASIGVADDAAAWAQNPAGLAALTNVPVREGAEYGNDMLFAYANTNEQNNWGLTWSGWKPSANFGYGVGYADPAAVTSVFGVGFGAGFSNTPLSAGINLLKVDDFVTYTPGAYVPQLFGGHMTTNILSAGLMYRISQGEGKAPIRLGATIVDIANDLPIGPIYNVGVGWKPSNNLLVAVDANDLSDEMNQGILVNGGIEYALHTGPQTWFGRAGLMDNGDEHKATVGMGYKCGQWRWDFSWVDADPDATWSVGVGCTM